MNEEEIRELLRNHQNLQPFSVIDQPREIPRTIVSNGLWIKGGVMQHCIRVQYNRYGSPLVVEHDKLIELLRRSVENNRIYQNIVLLHYVQAQGRQTIVPPCSVNIIGMLFVAAGLAMRHPNWQYQYVINHAVNFN